MLLMVEERYLYNLKNFVSSISLLEQIIPVLICENLKKETDVIESSFKYKLYENIKTNFKIMSFYINNGSHNLQMIELKKLRIQKDNIKICRLVLEELCTDLNEIIKTYILKNYTNEILRNNYITILNNNIHDYVKNNEHNLYELVNKDFNYFLENFVDIL